jgi:hypothetical protein
VPRRHKVLLGLVVAYLASPIDVVPDVIPVAGQLDDALLVSLALRAIVRAAGPSLVHEHWPGPQESLGLILRLTGLATHRDGPGRRHAEQSSVPARCDLDPVAPRPEARDGAAAQPEHLPAGTADLPEVGDRRAP